MKKKCISALKNLLILLCLSGLAISHQSQAALAALPQPGAGPALAQIRPALGLPSRNSAGETPIQWSPAPSCQNLPDAALAVNLLTGEKAAALAANIAIGRLNSQSQVEFASLPDIHTVGELMDRIESLNGKEIPSGLLDASQQILAGEGITLPVCARLLVTRSNGKPVDLLWSSQGVSAQPASSTQITRPETSTLPLDSGIASPDGKKTAFTSLNRDSGGPIYLFDLQSSAWTNIIQAANEHNPGITPLQADLWWEVIGWMPDSLGLMISPADLSSLYLVNLQDYSVKMYPFNGGGMGGGSVAGLSPDGRRFAFVGADSSGGQTLNIFDLTSGKTARLDTLLPKDGNLLYPRFSPDGSGLAYLVETGSPQTGVAQSIRLYTFSSGSERTLAQGSLGRSVPVWSPDGQYIAFTRNEAEAASQYTPGQEPAPMQANIWVATASNGKLAQLSFIDGWARSPAWNSDSQTLAFVTQNSQVGLVSLAQPGKIWLAAETPRDFPMMTSAVMVNFRPFQAGDISTAAIQPVTISPPVQASSVSAQAAIPNPVFRFPVVPNSVISGYFDHNPQSARVLFYNGMQNTGPNYGFYFSCSNPSMYDFVGCADPVNGEAACPNNHELWYDGHKGIDFEYSPNWNTGAFCDPARFSGITRAVYAPAAGKVMFAGYDANRPANGWHIRIRHDLNGNSNFDDDNFRSNFLHFTANALAVQTNDMVSEGQYLGLGGSTGYSSSPHLHFEVQRSSDNFATTVWSVDPYGWSGPGIDPWPYQNIRLWRTIGPDKTYLPLVQSSLPSGCPGCGEMLYNNGFESGSTEWTENGVSIIVSRSYQYLKVAPYAGNWLAWLGGRNSASDTLYQNFSVPYGLANARLRYRLRIDSAETGATAYDSMKVRLRGPDGSLIQDLETLDNTFSPLNQWVRRDIYLPGLVSHQGEILRLSFEATTDSNLITSFYLDEVSFTSLAP